MRQPLVLFVVPIFLLCGCFGENEPVKQAPAQIRTAEALEERLAELDVAIFEGSSFVKGMTTSRGYRFRYESSLDSADTYQQVQDYYRDEFGAGLVDQGWHQSPLSTPMRMIFTKDGETISVENAMPGASSVVGKQITYISHTKR